MNLLRRLVEAIETIAKNTSAMISQGNEMIAIHRNLLRITEDNHLLYHADIMSRIEAYKRQHKNDDDLRSE